MKTRECLLVCFLIGFLLGVVAGQCNPYYPRMFWNPDSPFISADRIDLIFMFNTNFSCPYSNVTIVTATRIHKVRCTQKKIETFDSIDTSLSQFVSYVQTCSVLVILTQEIETFKYKITGSKDIFGASSISSQEFEVEMPIRGLPLNIAVISDWGPIITKIYKPLNDTLDYILQRREKEKRANLTSQFRITALFLNGDYAYDLETNKCQMYLMFLNEVARVSRFWPILTSVGNHQSTRPKSMYLFENSFVIGRLSTKDGNFERTQSYRFKQRGTFVLFDPFLQIYHGKAQMQKYLQMKQAIQYQVVNARKQFPQQFLIMGSHYPVMCSQDDPHCRDAIKNMPDLYEWMSTPVEGKGLVDLYIGSHMHQYERIYPFVNNNYVIGEESPYSRGRLVSFVEAVAGVDYFIIQVDYPRQNFSVFATHNTTGMGILSITGRSDSGSDYQMIYQHIITPKTYEVVDRFVITRYFSQKQPQNLKTEKI